MREVMTSHQNQLSSSPEERLQSLLTDTLRPAGHSAAWVVPNDDYTRLAYCKVEAGQDIGKLEILNPDNGEVFDTGIDVDGLEQPSWDKEGGFLFGSADARGGVFRYDISEHRQQKLSPHYMGPYNEIASGRAGILFTTPTGDYGQEELRLVDSSGKDRGALLTGGEFSFSRQDGTLFLKTTNEAPDGRVLKVDLSHDTELKEVVPHQAGRVLRSIQTSPDSLALSYTVDGLPGVALLDAQGKELQVFNSQLPGAIEQLALDEDGNLNFQWSSTVNPPEQRRLNRDTGEVETLHRNEIDGFDPEQYSVEQQWFRSADGTRVPITMAHRKSLKKTGQNPTHVHVYGAFGQTENPGFQPELVPFLEAGGIYAIAHVRGGGALGEQWHRQATGANRSKTYEDLSGAADHLINSGWTAPEHLSVGGASAGGLAAAVAATKFASKFDAAVIDCAPLDMENYESLDGPSWQSEFGTLSNSREAQHLADWSPVKGIDPGQDYPAFLISMGDRDARVNPDHSIRFADALRAANPQNQVQLRIDEGQGHSYNGSLEGYVQRATDTWNFVLQKTVK